MTTIVLAAGLGRRLGGPKALLAWPGAHGRDVPLAAAHAEDRLAAESERVLVVVRPQLAPVLARWLPPRVELVPSTAAEQLGPAGSLAAAVAAGALEGIAVVTPVDSVPAAAATVATLLGRLDAAERCWAVRPRHRGRGGHPVVLRARALGRYGQAGPPPLRDHLRALGARVVDVAVPDPAVLVDLDTPDDLAALGLPAPRFLGEPDGERGSLRP